MGKVNCDVCGTAYPESATQCPICGCVRAAEASASDNGRPDNNSYTYVKGGRFSKANVRKRQQGVGGSDSPQKPDVPSENNQESAEKADKGLVIAVCVLLLAVIAVVIYIVTRFFAQGPVSNSNNGDQLIQTTDAPTISTTLIPEESDATESTMPEETVAPTVVETIPETEPTTQPTENANYYVEPYTLQKTDVTLYPKYSFDLKLIDAKGELMDVEWVVENPKICSVEGNTVTALKSGKTTVSVTINGVTYSCIVRVK